MTKADGGESVSNKEFKERAKRYIDVHRRHESLSDGGCWEAINRPRKNGYVRISFMRSSWYWHRLSYEAFRGEIPPGMDVCHKCDNRICGNPSHLFVGSRKDNMLDAKKKGRMSNGIQHGIKVVSAIRKRGCCKLTIEKAREIKKMLINGHPRGEIAKEFGIDRSMVNRIGRNAAWKEYPQVVLSTSVHGSRSQ